MCLDFVTIYDFKSNIYDIFSSYMFPLALLPKIQEKEG
jgi:hypothetical protein